MIQLGRENDGLWQVLSSQISLLTNVAIVALLGGFMLGALGTLGGRMYCILQKSEACYADQYAPSFG